LIRPFVAGFEVIGDIMTIPSSGLAGDLRVVAVVDSDNNLTEQKYTNNTALALNDVQVPTALTLNMSVSCFDFGLSMHHSSHALLAGASELACAEGEWS